MNPKKQKVLSRCLNGLIDAGIALTFLAMAAVPFVLAAFFKASEFPPVNDYTDTILTVSILLCAVPYVCALFFLRRIGRLMTGEKAFSPEMARQFVRISVCAWCEAVLSVAVTLTLTFAFDIYLYALTVIPCFIVVFLSVTAGFLSLVFAGIFTRAAEIKEENDLTF